MKDVQIEDVLKYLSANFAINFTYVNNDIPLSKVISIHSENQSLKLVLDQIFQGTLVKYYEIETQILLKKEDELVIDAVSGDSSLGASKNTSPNLLKIHSENARYSVLEKGKYKLHFSLDNLFRLRFNTFKRKRYWSQLSPYQQAPVDSMDVLLKDSTLTKKEKRKIIRHRRIVRNAAQPFYRFALGVFAAPERTFRQLSGNSSEYVSERNQFEDWRWNYSAGISLDYFLTRHLFLRSGISFLNFGEMGRYRVEKPYVLPSQTTNTDTTIAYSNNLNTFGLPICIGFKTGGRLSFSLSTGVIIAFMPQQHTTYPAEKNETYSYTSEYVVNPKFIPAYNRPNPFDKAPNENPLFQQRPFQAQNPPQGQNPPPQQVLTDVYSITTTAYYYRDYLDPRKHQLRSINYLYTLSFELGYKISEKVQVVVRPTFNYFLTSIYANGDDMQQRPYSLGVSLGATYFFRKKK